MTYIVGHPIKYPADFYGRQAEVSRFFEIIGGTQAQSAAVLGVRRAGKTSFLQYISNAQTVRNYLAHPEQVTMIYLDISTCKTPADFYYRLLLRLRYALGEVDTTVLWQPSPPTETNMYDVEAYLCQFPNQRIILLLDEFDHIRTDTFTPDFLIELRAMTSVMEYDLAFVTASYRDLFYLGSQVGLPPTSPFYNIFYPSPIHLAGLDTAVLEDLIRTPAMAEGLPFTDEEVAQLLQLAGTYPFFVQATAVQVLARKKEKQPIQFSQIAQQLTLELSPYFEQWWRHFEAQDRIILKAVLQQQPFHELSLPNHLLDETLRILHLYGLIMATNEGWQINGRIFQNWITNFAHNVEAKMAREPKRETAVNPTTLRKVLIDSFNIDELHALCFDLKLDFENLPGDGKFAKAQSLVEHFRNRQRLEQLITAVRNERGAII